MPFNKFGDFRQTMGSLLPQERIYRWQTPTLQNGWVNYGGGYIASGYKELPAGGVALRGLVRDGTANQILTLPASLHPSGHLIFAAETSSGTMRVDVRDNGVVQVSGTTPTWVDLTNIVFWNER